jgi:Zn-finger nucleic acid-binding protein
VLRPSRLICPACRRNGGDVALMVVPSAKIEFHHCRGCGGAWFYEKDMDAALRATCEHEWPVPDTAPAPSAAASNIPELNWMCPCCSGNLVAVKDRRGSGATVHRCLVCYGGWIDHDDVLKAAEASAGVLSKIGAMLRTMWAP